MWIVTGMAELTVAGIYVQYWFPQFPQWVTALAALAALYAVNLIAVSLFGEFEFWFALIKVVTIVALILVGLSVIIFGLGELGQTASFANLWENGGFFPLGPAEVFLALPIVLFAFFGMELVGITAGEAEDPERTLPSAINKVLWRIAIFYVGALIVIMSLVPWDQISPEGSPFVLVFDRIGLPAAGSVINFVVITAALSAFNSGLFSTGRMLYALAGRGQAPRVFRRVNGRKVPAVGITASAAVMLIAVLLSYVVPERVFLYVASVGTLAGMWTWAMIVLAHLGYRRAAREGRLPRASFRMPGAPWTNWLVLAFLALVVVLMALGEDTRIVLYVAPAWFAVLAVGYWLVRRQPTQPAPTSAVTHPNRTGQ